MRRDAEKAEGSILENLKTQVHNFFQRIIRFASFKRIKPCSVIQIIQEEAKRDSWKVENVRRAHNYIPLVYNLVHTLAKSGKLKDLRSAAAANANAE